MAWPAQGWLPNPRPARAPVGCQAGDGPAGAPPNLRYPVSASADPALPWPARSRRAVQRSVQLLVSWQYQRTSSHALPPSATMLLAGCRVPHIQQDCTPADRIEG